MRILLILLIAFLHVKNGFSQASFFDKSDTLNLKRFIPVSAGIGTVWAGSMIGLHKVWYSQVSKTKFHTFNDSKNWLQMDKVGHVYTANKISNLTGELFEWSGMNSKKSAFLGAGIGLGYQTTLEFFDAFSSDWGFSWSDEAANIIGSSIYLSQKLIWNEQLFNLKFSYHPTEYADLRPAVLGSNFQERLLKDYNGQTYWLSFNPLLFNKNLSFPKWICLSFGYSVNSKLVGDKETYIDQNNIVYNSSREYIFSLDIDFSKIPVKKSWVKVLLKQLNYLKLPFPAIIVRDGQIIGVPIYF